MVTSADGALVASLVQGIGNRGWASVQYGTRRLQPMFGSSPFSRRLEPETGQASVLAASPSPIVNYFTNSTACQSCIFLRLEGADRTITGSHSTGTRLIDVGLGSAILVQAIRSGTGLKLCAPSDGYKASADEVAGARDGAEWNTKATKGTRRARVAAWGEESAVAKAMGVTRGGGRESGERTAGWASTPYPARSGAGQRRGMELTPFIPRA